MKACCAAVSGTDAALGATWLRPYRGLEVAGPGLTRPEPAEPYFVTVPVTGSAPGMVAVPAAAFSGAERAAPGCPG